MSKNLKSNKIGYNNKILNNGTMRPIPEKTVDTSRSYISSKATNLNSQPMYYPIGDVPNFMMSTTNPAGYSLMKFGKNTKVRNEYSNPDIYGNLYSSPGNLYPSYNTLKNPPMSITVDYNGNYKLVNQYGKSYKMYNDKKGSYITSNKQKYYF